jgi:hypothetical protein
VLFTIKIPTIRLTRPFTEFTATFQRSSRLNAVPPGWSRVKGGEKRPGGLGLGATTGHVTDSKGVYVQNKRRRRKRRRNSVLSVDR